MLSLTARLVWARWPAILALYLAGALGRYLFLELAGWAGAYSAPVGVLILPLGVLCRLVSYAAMFLLLRDSMPVLSALAPLSEDPRERRREFLGAIVGAVLPFFASYAALGYLREDAQAYYLRVLEVNTGLAYAAAFGDESEQAGDGALGYLDFGPMTLGIIVAVYALRWLIQRYSAKLPRAVSLVGVYLEALWVWLSVTIVADAFARGRTWIDQRQAAVWVADARERVAEVARPMSWIWDGVDWLVGAAGGVLLVPVAWLTVAGVIYGRAIAVKAATPTGDLAEGARARFGRLPRAAQRRLTDLWRDFTLRFRGIWNALLLMWHAGPVLIGSYVLLYSLLLLAAAWVQIGVFRMLGPHDTAFWVARESVLLMLAPLVTEPIRVALIASAFDRALGVEERSPRAQPRSRANLSPEGSSSAE